MTAVPVGASLGTGPLRVATKFVNIAKRYFAEQGRQVEIIGLSGAMEIAPLMGLADCIVDIVETGNTLVRERTRGARRNCERQRASHRESRVAEDALRRDRVAC